MCLQPFLAVLSEVALIAFGSGPLSLVSVRFPLGHGVPEPKSRTLTKRGSSVGGAENLGPQQMPHLMCGSHPRPGGTNPGWANRGWTRPLNEPPGLVRGWRLQPRGVARPRASCAPSSGTNLPLPRPAPDNQFRMSILERLEQMERRMAEMTGSQQHKPGSAGGGSGGGASSGTGGSQAQVPPA